MLHIPRQEKLRLRPQRTRREQRVVQHSSHDPVRCRFANRIEIFVPIQRNQGQVRVNILKKQNGLIAAQTLFTRQSRDGGIDLSETVSRTAGRVSVSR